MKDYFKLTEEERKQLADERSARPRPAAFAKPEESTTSTTTQTVVETTTETTTINPQ